MSAVNLTAIRNVEWHKVKHTFRNLQIFERQFFDCQSAANFCQYLN